MSKIQQVINLYKQNEYLLLQEKVIDICKKYNIDNRYVYKKLKENGISKRKLYEKICNEFNPKYNSIESIKRILKLKFITKATLNNLAKQKYGIRYRTEKELEYLELHDDINALKEEYPYPMVQLGRNGIINYLGININMFYRLRQKHKWYKDIEYRKIFRKYPLGEYSHTEIANIFNIEEEKLRTWSKRNIENRPKYSVSFYVVKSRKNIYGSNILQKKKITMKELKKWFEDKLINNGYVHIKDIKKELGRSDMCKMLYAIKKRYGLDVNYTFNKHKMQYERI